MLVMHAAVGSFNFAALESPIKKPTRAGASEYSVSRSIATHMPHAFPLRVLYISQP